AGEVDAVEVEDARIAPELARERLDLRGVAPGYDRTMAAAHGLAGDELPGVAVRAVDHPRLHSRDHTALGRLSAVGSRGDGRRKPLRAESRQPRAYMQTIRI